MESKWNVFEHFLHALDATYGALYLHPNHIVPNCEVMYIVSYIKLGYNLAFCNSPIKALRANKTSVSCVCLWQACHEVELGADADSLGGCSKSFSSTISTCEVSIAA